MSEPFCFVICPIGDSGSPTRRRADGVLDEIIKPALEGYRVERADHDKSPGIVTESIITKILDADLVVADLSGLNPNVMYELAIRHAVGKPVIQILETGQDLPFDISSQNTIYFSPDLAGRRDAVREIQAAEKAVREKADLGNPIKRTVELRALKASNKAEDKVVVQALADVQVELTSMRRELQAIRASANVGRAPGFDMLAGLLRAGEIYQSAGRTDPSAFQLIMGELAKKPGGGKKE